MTDTQKQTIKYWLKKICRECEKHGIEYGIFADEYGWEENLDRFLAGNFKKLVKPYEQCDINILGFHIGPEGSTFGSTYDDGDGYYYWEISFTTLLDPEFHAAFDAEFEYRRFIYLFGGKD